MRRRTTRVGSTSPELSTAAPQSSSSGGSLDDHVRDLQGSAGNAAIASLISDDVEGASRDCGSQLPDGFGKSMEAAFGADLGDVRVHDGPTAAALSARLEANAFTHGDDIFIGDGAPDQTSVEGQHLLAHELAHVIQQRRVGPKVDRDPVIGTPGDASEREADEAAEAAVRGDPVPDLTPTAVTLQGDFWGSITDLLGETETDRYEDSQSDLEDFLGEPHEAENFQSETGIGAFDATYDPNLGTLLIECRCHFEFVPGLLPYLLQGYPLDVLTWDEDAKADWKARFLATCSEKWSAGAFTFHCQRDWWEHLVANVQVSFVESDESAHFNLSVTKIPPGEFQTSSVGRPETGFWGGFEPGTGSFDSEDLDEVDKGIEGSPQVPAVHEAGHMLGLDDEYVESGEGEPSHAGMVESEFGEGWGKADDGRIMSKGSDIQPEHGVVFLAALKEATGMEQWATAQRPPRPVPLEGQMGDFPIPSGDSGWA